MPSVTRQGDKCSGHDSCSATPLTSGSPNVLVNSLPCGRQSDTYAPHSCPVHAAHSDKISGGSGTVLVNGLPIARVGDSVVTSGTVSEGSPNVLAN